MSLRDKIKITQRKLISDSRGWFLKVIDGSEENLPGFTGEIYFTNASVGQSKGRHYHADASEWFFLLTGSCNLFLIDVKSKEELVISLSALDPKTIYVPNMVAHTFVNTGNAEFTLMAYTDKLYDPADTIPYEFNCEL
ncbi:WxcM-like domain-containing protein [Chryseobacterium sp. Leaf394]|uniref:polysaccharide biosynthesis C-terminal domain-containing protein n=1 Tax=Chryseobacterium sp. Leaf394 TaxID=1736361 RepID=UPI0006FC4ABD|nr:WxcM-like domain-containing protein [Chryseobacterium sp. Leaf394]KQS93207.1 hypothetical protein ASG21_12520 [Chryseobacterium sp. Leaf394]